MIDQSFPNEPKLDTKNINWSCIADDIEQRLEMISMIIVSI